MSTQEYKNPWAELRTGDLVRVSKGEDAHEGRWEDNGIFGYLPNVEINWDSVGAEGWIPAVIEKAKPKLDSATAEWILAEVDRRVAVHPFGHLSALMYLRETVEAVQS